MLQYTNVVFIRTVPEQADHECVFQKTVHMLIHVKKENGDEQPNSRVCYSGYYVSLQEAGLLFSVSSYNSVSFPCVMLSGLGRKTDEFWFLSVSLFWPEQLGGVAHTRSTFARSTST